MNKLIIELGGKERTLRFNTLFIKLLAEVTEQYPVGTDNVSATAIFVYAGLKADSILTGRALDVSFVDCFETVEDWALNGQDEKIQRIVDAYYSSTVYNFIEESKKKIVETSEQIGTSSEDMPLENSV